MSLSQTVNVAFLYDSLKCSLCSVYCCHLTVIICFFCGA